MFKKLLVLAVICLSVGSASAEPVPDAACRRFYERIEVLEENLAAESSPGRKRTRAGAGTSRKSQTLPAAW